MKLDIVLVNVMGPCNFKCVDLSPVCVKNVIQCQTIAKSYMQSFLTVATPSEVNKIN